MSLAVLSHIHNKNLLLWLYHGAVMLSIYTIHICCITGWNDSSVIKSTCCSCREPRFESQHLQWTVHPCLKLQLEEIQCHLLVSVGTECIWHMIQPEWEKMGFCQVIPVLLLLIPKILRGHDHPGTGCNGFMVILDYFLWETVPRQDPHRSKGKANKKRE
eukprot:XP_017445631.1 PREDICTED: uncharacterized protein LOC108348727 isoform X2 [Rattus norvegicus]